MNHPDLSYPVRQSIEVGGVKVVLLDVPIKEILNENIYGLDSGGHLLWQIEQIPRTTENAPFVSMQLHNGIVRAVSWDGVMVWLDPTTGKALDRTWHK